MIRLTAPSRLRGSVAVPGDKSISHRAAMFNAIAEGNARVAGFLDAADPRATIACLQALGVRIEQENGALRIYGRGLRGLREPQAILDCGNSGTTLRLLAGLLAGQPMFSVLSGDASLRSRPQRRIIEPLRALGATIDGRLDGDRAPLAMRGARLHGGTYNLPIASAQVKSALLLACLTAEAPLSLGGRIDSRDHTERMLQAMGIDLTLEDGRLILYPPAHPVFPYPVSLTVPGDPSSAAFWWVAAAIHPDAEITTVGVSLNPTRTGAIDALRAMGAQIEIHSEHSEGNEPVGAVTVRSSQLHGTRVDGSLVPRIIDEIPVLAVAAAAASGETVIADAAELRAKETDRIAAVSEQLGRMGAYVEPTDDGMVIAGGDLQAAEVHSCDDHRLAMALGVAALVAGGETTLHGHEAVGVSYPTFWQHLRQLRE